MMNILDFGAVRGERCTQAIQQAIDTAAVQGGGQVVVPVGEFETAFVTMGGDVKASCVTTMLLKELGVKHVVAKASDDFHGRMLEKLGADKIVFPERDMGKRIAHNLVSGNLLEYIELSPDFSMAEILADPAWSGRTLSELHLRDQLGINVVAVRSGEKFNPLPTSGTVIQEGDIMLVVAGEETLLGLNKRK